MSAPFAPTFDATGKLPIISKTSLIFYWGTPSGSPTSYTLSSLEDPTSYTIPAPANSYEVTNLIPGQSYTFSITATNANGTSPPAVYQTVQLGIAPNPPTNVTVTSVDPTKCLLYWNSATAQDDCTLRGYVVNGQSTIPLCVEPYRTTTPITYTTQPTTLYMNATTDPGYSVDTYVPFINNNYILRVAPYMFQSTTQTITDYTSTSAFSSVGAGQGMAATNISMTFNNANYLQGPAPLPYVLSSYTITTWLQQPGLTSNTTGNILGDANNSNYMNLPAGPVLGNYLLYPSSVGVCDGTPGLAGSNGGGGGGSGFGGGGGGAGYVGNSNGLMNGYGGGGGGSYTQGGQIYPGNQTTPGNTNNPNYIDGFANQTSSGLIVLNFFSDSEPNGENFVVSSPTGVLTSVLSSFTIPENTTSITANLWGAGGAQGAGRSAGGAGAAVVQSFSTTFQTALAYYQGGAGQGAAGGSGNLGAGGAGGDSSYLSVNGQIIAIAGGGGGGGAIVNQSQANGFNPGGGGGGQNAPTSQGILNYGGQAGCNGVTMGYISSGVHLNIGSNFIIAQGARVSTVGGGGGGFGGGACLVSSTRLIGGAGGGSFTIGGTIYPGVSSIAGNLNSSKYIPSYAVGTSLTNSPTSGLAVLSFFDAAGSSTGPDAQFLAAGIATVTVPANTTSITAYVWGAGAGGGTFAAVPTTTGGGGACVVQRFNYTAGNSVTVLIGQGNLPMVSSLGGGVGSSGGASAVFYNNSCILIAGGGGGGFANNGMGGNQSYNLQNNIANAGSNGLGGQVIGQTVTAANAAGSNCIIRNGGINLNTGWTHVALVASTNTFALYSNAIPVSTNFTSLPYYYLPSTSQVFQIGNGFNGNIGETIVYPRALGAQEVLSNFTASPYYGATTCNIWNANSSIRVTNNQTITQPVQQANWNAPWALTNAALTPPFYLSCQFAGNNMYSGITSIANPASIGNFTALQFAINFNRTSIGIYESGINVFNLTGTFNSTSAFLINCTTSNVSYLLNASTMYVSFTPPPTIPHYAAIGISTLNNTACNINFVSMPYWNTNLLTASTNQTLIHPIQQSNSWIVSQRSFVSPYASCQFNGSNIFFGITTNLLNDFSATGVTNAENLLEFGMQLSTPTDVVIYEGGNTPFALQGSFGPTNVFRINCTTSNITYLNNGSIFYTSLLTPQIGRSYFTAVGMANQFNSCSNIQIGSLYGSYSFTAGAFMSLTNNLYLPLFNQPYTIEAWVNISSFSEAAICGWGGFVTTADAIEFRVTATGVNGLNHSWSNNNQTVAVPNLTNRFWHHVVAQYNGSALSATRTIYVDGVLLSTNTPNPTTNDVPTGNNFTVGRANGTRNFNGLITNLRIVKGVVYSGNFTVPTSPLTATQAAATNISAIGPGQTVLLLDATGNNPYQDKSQYGYTMTPTGMTISSNSPFPFVY
jgi:hypothetical protein